MSKSKAAGSIRVLVADDHTIFREGLCRLLEAEADMRVIGEAASGSECVSLVRELKPDILLLDLKMPGEDGLAVLTELGGADSQV